MSSGWVTTAASGWITLESGAVGGVMRFSVVGVATLVLFGTVWYCWALACFWRHCPGFPVLLANVEVSGRIGSCSGSSDHAGVGTGAGIFLAVLLKMVASC